MKAIRRQNIPLSSLAQREVSGLEPNHQEVRVLVLVHVHLLFAFTTFYIYFMYFLEDKACQKLFISLFTWKTHKFNSFYSRTGSILKKHLHHSHFTGTIQVMKAVATHLVLTFCERNELFTIILTRTKSIPVDVSTLSR